MTSVIPASTARPVPSLRGLWTSLRLLGGSAVEDEAWSEHWLAADAVLTRVVDALRLARLARRVEVADGWEQRHDVSATLGRWLRVDLSMLVEEHAGGRVLVRQRVSLRPRSPAVVLGVLSLAAVLATAAGVLGARWPSATVLALLASAVAVLSAGAYRTAAALAGVRGVVAHALAGLGAEPVGRSAGRVRLSADISHWKQAARSALATLVVAGVIGGGGLLVRDTARWASGPLVTPPLPPSNATAAARPLAPVRQPLPPEPSRARGAGSATASPDGTRRPPRRVTSSTAVGGVGDAETAVTRSIRNSAEARRRGAATRRAM